MALPIAAQNRRVLCAAPGYLAGMASRGSWSNWRSTDCLLFMLGSRVHDHWSFHDGKREVSLTVQRRPFQRRRPMSCGFGRSPRAGIAYKYVAGCGRGCARRSIESPDA